jgi:hypothetical protein
MNILFFLWFLNKFFRAIAEKNVVPFYSVFFRSSAGQVKKAYLYLCYVSFILQFYNLKKVAKM